MRQAPLHLLVGCVVHSTVEELLMLCVFCCASSTADPFSALKHELFPWQSFAFAVVVWIRRDVVHWFAFIYCCMSHSAVDNQRNGGQHACRSQSTAVVLRADTGSNVLFCSCVVVTVALGVGVVRLAPRLLNEEFGSREDWAEVFHTCCTHLAPCF